MVTKITSQSAHRESFTGCMFCGASYTMVRVPGRIKRRSSFLSSRMERCVHSAVGAFDVLLSLLGDGGVGSSGSAVCGTASETEGSVVQASQETMREEKSMQCA